MVQGSSRSSDPAWPIRQLFRELEHQSRSLGTSWGKGQVKEQCALLRAVDYDLEQFDKQALPRSLWVVWGMIGWLTVVGIGCPLMVLSGGVLVRW